MIAILDEVEEKSQFYLATLWESVLILSFLIGLGVVLSNVAFAAFNLEGILATLVNLLAIFYYLSIFVLTTRWAITKARNQ